MRRSLETIRSTAGAAALAVLLLLALATNASAAGPPAFEQAPANQSSVVGTPIIPVIVKGTNLALVTAKALPLGLTLKQIGSSETEWEISGTPTVSKAATKVTLEAENTEKATAPPVEFEWTVKEALPTIESPGTQSSVAGTPITPVIVKGTNMATVTAKELPAGLGLTKVSETVWEITGTPSIAQAATTVTLEASNKEKAPVQTATFKWTVKEAAATIQKPADQSNLAGTTIATVVVKGTNLALVSAEELPAGLKLNKVSEAEWTITGTLTTPKATTVVTLKAANVEGTPVSSTTFTWTVSEALTTIEKPADQASTAGTPITTVIVKGINLASLTAKELPAGLQLTKVSEAEWTITGTPTTPKAATTVTLQASNNEEAPLATTTLQWTVKEPEVAAKPPTSAPPPSPPGGPVIVPSAGRLGTLPVQKPGKSLTASFLCEVANCKVQITATITAGKKKFKIHSARTAITQGQKAKIALKLSKAQQALIVATLKKHKKVTAALAASIDSSVGLQVTKALVISVKR
jgi:hypothetical protein